MVDVFQIEIASTTPAGFSSSSTRRTLLPVTSANARRRGRFLSQLAPRWLLTLRPAIHRFLRASSEAVTFSETDCTEVLTVVEAFLYRRLCVLPPAVQPKVGTDRPHEPQWNSGPFGDRVIRLAKESVALLILLLSSGPL